MTWRPPKKRLRWESWMIWGLQPGFDHTAGAHLLLPAAEPVRSQGHSAAEARVRRMVVGEFVVGRADRARPCAPSEGRAARRARAESCVQSIDRSKITCRDGIPHGALTARVDEHVSARRGALCPRVRAGPRLGKTASSRTQGRRCVCLTSGIGRQLRARMGSRTQPTWPRGRTPTCSSVRRAPESEPTSLQRIG